MQEQTVKTCEYEGCNRPINTPHDDRFCVFHAPKENKGIDVDAFNELIVTEKIEKKDFNFNGYMFPGNIELNNVDFTDSASFINAQFTGSVSFIETRFSGPASFSGAQFSGDAYYWEATFLDSADFSKVNFSNTDFLKATFLKAADFSESTFSGKADYSKATFSGKANFSESTFAGDASFFESTFAGVADFNKATFSGETDFSKATFSGIAAFTETTFSGYAIYIKATFSGEASFFEATSFSGETDFSEAAFTNVAYFVESTFTRDVSFFEAMFLGVADFSETCFLKAAHFVENRIACKLIFKNISLLEHSYFYLKKPVYGQCDESDAFVIFEGIQFPPYRVFFENISSNKCVDSKEKLCILFRNCQLEDVSFINNNMSFFSFYKSNFDQARFISCNWGKDNDTVFLRPYKRKNIIFEEHLLLNIPEDDKEKKAYCERYLIDDLEMREVSSLYRRMKTALDRTKDYQESGWFYFNEFETKRRELPNGRKKIIYHLYKVFSGYGEKPFWSFIWLILFSMAFSFFHLLSGINTPDGAINYDLTLKYQEFKNIFSMEFLGDWFNAITFTFYRLIPVNYMPTTDNAITPVGLHGLFLALLNTFVLVLMLTFIGIGLKRHFKRF